MKKMLKKNPDFTKTVLWAFDAIMTFLTIDAEVSAPDLSDQRAECIYSCDVAVGGVLLQWQHSSGKGPGPPPATSLRGVK